MYKYEELSKDLQERMNYDRETGNTPDFACKDKDAIRRKANDHDAPNFVRSAFVRDVDKIMNCPYYNRYTDKTQVFSFYKNDDVSRRGLHVQFVSRIARTIGSALCLNTDLIEAIALGHDLGHTPFGHAGEKFLDEVYCEKTGRHFMHNVHSVRVLDGIFCLNVSLPTLSGIVSHNGELELDEYKPSPLSSFADFDVQTENCYTDPSFVKKLIPSTLEGCVVRLSDIIAYIGKDRQDAERLHLVNTDEFPDYGIGITNAEIINNLVVNVIENSYGHNYIKMDALHFSALKKAKSDDYKLIYENPSVRQAYSKVGEMTKRLYERLLTDLKNGNKSSPVYKHHIEYLDKEYIRKRRSEPYLDTEKNQIVVDFLASMTDDYFADLYGYLFPDEKIPLEYIGYFDE